MTQNYFWIHIHGIRMHSSFLMNAAESGMKHYGNMLLPTVRLRSILQLPVSLITGPGSMSHGHGRKEAAEYVEL